ncbi:MAG: transglycosylase domain-containing protein [Hyphomicrobiaceae bacterium]
MFRSLTRLAELVLLLPLGLVRIVLGSIAFNPRLGPLRYLTSALFAYVAFALVLVYVVAPVRGIVGSITHGDKLRYDAERWLATAIYDAKGGFVGTFDPRLDSRRDVNYTDAAIEVGDYVANPDHKSVPVREVPDLYWRCLVYHEDRYLGGPLNPAGIDLIGVLKIPYTTVVRSIAQRRPSLGVGGSTLPMQLARVIYKTPPSGSEGAFTKLSRKVSEWWLAPVIYRVLTAGGDDTPLRQWAANHLWLAQRTGGQPLHGVEVTSRIVFGKEAKDLSAAEQFVLASAVNKPIILLEGNERLNEVRLDRWRYITEVRARTCAEKLISDPDEQRKVVFELVNLAGGPPDPKVKPRLQEALDRHAPLLARRAQANPVIRANALLPAARFGLREELKQAYGFDWRQYARGVTTTLDPVDNLVFDQAIRAGLKTLDAATAPRRSAGTTLDPAAVSAGVVMPDVVVVAADLEGRIVRYFETGERAPYFGSASAKDPGTGFYRPPAESRTVASTGKMLAAIALANEGRDDATATLVDTQAPERGLETCAKGDGRHGRKAIVAFACSLNTPLLLRAAQIGQAPMRRLIDGFGFTMPPRSADGEDTPPSTAAVLGHIAGSPRRVHHMSSVVLASLIGQPGRTVRPPSLIAALDHPDKAAAATQYHETLKPLVAGNLIRPAGVPTLRALLEAPLCYASGGTSHGTLKSLGAWCAARRPDVRLHFAKTGTSTTSDASQTVDTWITGGVQFASGAAYSYVVLIGTGSTSQPWATNLHGGQIGAPLLAILLEDLARHAKTRGRPDLLPRRPAPAPLADASRVSLQRNEAERARIFTPN